MNSTRITQIAEDFRRCHYDKNICENLYKSVLSVCYTVAGKAVGFALDQPLHVVALLCSALRILKRLQHKRKIVPVGHGIYS
jgi:hypothetical protein